MPPDAPELRASTQGAAAQSAADDEYLARALELAAKGLYTTDPNPRVGCVLVSDDKVIAEGWHARAGEPHAEVMALRTAGERAKGATAYVSLEPCNHTGRTPPCTDALLAAGVSRVACSTLDPNPLVAGRGVERLRSAGVAVSVGGMARAARALNPGFFSRFERGRPYVRLKLAMSLDGRTAPASGGRVPGAPAGGGPTWITGEAARADVQILRARSSAVLTGAGTVRTDDPLLNVRLDYGPWVRQPLRVVLDPQLSCSPRAKIFKDPGAIVFAAQGESRAANRGEGLDLRVEWLPRCAGGVDLHAVLSRLNELEINELLVECGPRLAGAFLREGLVDEWVVYIAPTLLGADALPLVAFGGLELAGHSAGFGAVNSPWTFESIERVGVDLRVVLRPEKR